jgi:hypothetical protein
MKIVAVTQKDVLELVTGPSEQFQSYFFSLPLLVCTMKLPQKELSSKLKIIPFPDVYSYLFPFFFHATSKLKEGEKVKVNI